MKKYIILLFAIIFVLQGCQTHPPAKSESSTFSSADNSSSSVSSEAPSDSAEHSDIASSSASSSSESNPQNTWKLLLHGVDISNSCHFFVDSDAVYTEVGLLAVMKELGAKMVLWTDETHASIYFSDDEIYTLDTEAMSMCNAVTGDYVGSLCYYGGNVPWLAEKRGEEFVIRLESLTVLLYREPFDLNVHKLKTKQEVRIHSKGACDC